MIETERLTLRSWLEADRAPWAAMCADPRVMATIGPLQTRAQADAGVDRYHGYARDHGFTIWAVKRRADGRFIGLCGLKPGAPATPIEAQVEIGWRLAVDTWGRGYAREGAEASLGWAWAHLGCARVSAITAATNARSRALMARLSMVHDAALDFRHPALAADHPLAPHVTYCLDRPRA